MNRKRRERELAGPLYIEQQKNLDEIALQLSVSRRTVGYWKVWDKWEERRQDFIGAKTRSAESLERLIYDLEKEIAADRKAKRKPSTSRLYALRGLQKQLLELRKEKKRELDDIPEAPAKDKLPPLTQAHFLAIERETFGLHANATRN